jgi:hypothetical protein
LSSDLHRSQAASVVVVRPLGIPFSLVTASRPSGRLRQIVIHFVIIYSSIIAFVLTKSALSHSPHPRAFTHEGSSTPVLTVNLRLTG